MVINKFIKKSNLLHIQWNLRLQNYSCKMLVSKNKCALETSLLFFVLCISVCSISGAWPEHCPKIVGKKQWGGRTAAIVEYAIVPVEYVVVHHTVTPTCTSQTSCTNMLKSIQDFHMDELDFHDIGYNFLVGGDGQIYEGTGWYKVGAHTRGYNTKSIGLSFIGDFSKERPEKAQLQVAKEFIKCAIEIGALSENYQLFGAKKVSATVSPGRFIYDEIKKWPHFTESPLIS